ncbi:MAG: GFA family protein [Chromatiales bacterium]|nr:GFA family protein [Chromatiales bacterium]
MKKNEDKPYKGQCLCGAIKYEVDEMTNLTAHCHCSMCRKFHGAAFATFGEARKERFRWIEGEEHLKSYVADNGTTRQFCDSCGSSMTFHAPTGQDDIVEFTLGTLDSDITLRPDAHIYVGSKASWSDICDDLPQYVDGRDSEKIT